jgi:hypothetical protein
MITIRVDPTMILTAALGGPPLFSLRFSARSRQDFSSRHRLMALHIGMGAPREKGVSRGRDEG